MTDRDKIKTLAEAFGDEYQETRLRVRVPAWGKAMRFNEDGEMISISRMVAGSRKTIVLGRT